jgi:hypothetical protein
MRFIRLCVVVLATGCVDNGYEIPQIDVPPEIPLDELRNSADTIVVEGRTLTLSTDLWRDFQPISPPDGKPLICILYITATDTARLPTGISSDGVWIVYGQQTWRSYFSKEARPPGEADLNQIIEIARDGPKWGPGVDVDVIVRVFDGKGTSQLLRAPDQPIGRTG